MNQACWFTHFHGSLNIIVIFPGSQFFSAKYVQFPSILWPIKNDVRFEYFPWKMSDFVSFLLFLCTFAIKLRNFDFESHWNTLIFFDRKTYDVRFEYVHGSFCFILSVWVDFSHTTQKFWFWKSLKYFNIFSSKNKVRFDQTVSFLG